MIISNNELTIIHEEKDGYGYDVYYDEKGIEICRCGKGMTKQNIFFTALDLFNRLTIADACKIIGSGG
jgi:hypothetical protein